MKLLIITQKIDKKDPVLGFFHNWILKLAEKIASISVVCLEKGEYDFPGNVRVYSLGKTDKKLPLFSRTKYLTNFYRYILGLHADYDAVFVHMNQEYIVLGGFIWRILRRRVYFWRNHPHGNLFTRLAARLSYKIFCTSKDAFVARYEKTKIMPAGIDTNKFIATNNQNSPQVKNSILFLGRMSSIKKPELLLEALNVLSKSRSDFTCDFYGDPLPNSKAYYENLKIKAKDWGLENRVRFHKGVSNDETPQIYRSHELFVNLTPTGSFDKTILEAAACGCQILVANKSLLGEIDEAMILKNSTAEEIANRIEFLLNMENDKKSKISEKLKIYVKENHSLDLLVDQLAKQF